MSKVLSYNLEVLDTYPFLMIATIFDTCLSEKTKKQEKLSFSEALVLK